MNANDLYTVHFTCAAAKPAGQDDPTILGDTYFGGVIQISTQIFQTGSQFAVKQPGRLYFARVIDTKEPFLPTQQVHFMGFRRPEYHWVQRCT